MATVAELLVKITGDNSGLRKELAASQRQMKRAFGPESLEMSGTAAGLLAGLAAAMGVAGVASVKMASDMQASQKAFTTLLGDTQKAERFLNDLSKFAAETPFELPGLMSASKKLLAFGFAAEDIIPMMAAIGDSAAMLGMGEEGITRMTTAIGQMQAKGKVSAEEMMQLAEAGVPAWRFLADGIGKSIPEAMKLAEQGAIDSTTGINAVLMGMQTKFKGGMEGLAKEIPGLWSTIKDNVAAAAREIGDNIIAGLDLKNRMQGIADYFGSFAEYVKGSGLNAALRDLIPKELTLGIFAVAGAITLAAIPAMYAFAVATWTAMAPLLPFIAIGAAIGALAWVIWQNWAPISQYFSKLWSTITTAFSQTWENIKTTWQTTWNAMSSILDSAWNVMKPIAAAAAAAIGVAMLPIIVAITTAALAVSLIYENWGPLTEWVKNLWTGITTTVSDTWKRITDSIDNGITSASNFVTDGWQTVCDFTASIWDSIVSALSDAWNWIVGIVNENLGWAVNYISSGWNTIVEVTSSIWSGVVTWVDNAWASIKNIVAVGVNWVISKLQPLMNLINVSIPQGINNIVDQAGAKVDQIKQSLSNINLGFNSPDISKITGGNKPNTAFTGLHGGGASASSASGGGGSGGKSDAEKEWEKLEQKAKQVSESIEREWVQTTHTKVQQLEIWLQEELSALEKSKSANENYERDLARVKAVYAERKEKLDQEELNRITQIKRAAQDIVANNENGSMSIGLKGVDKQAFDLKIGMDKEIKDITRKYEDMVNEFAKLDESAKQANIKAWQETNLAFKANEDGTIDFTEEVEKEKYSIKAKYAKLFEELDARRVKFQEQIEEAKKEGDIARFAALLQEKQALEAQDLAGRQAMINTYYTIWQDAHRAAMDYMSEATSTAYTGLTTLFADIFSGAKTAGDAWKSLGSTVGNMLSKMAAQWVASRLMMALLGKSTMAGETAASVAAGAATAAAWAPAAAMVSLASFGANAAPAMAGIGATTALSLALSIPGFAGGGAIKGPGTGTSDSVLSWLSNGEYVMRTAAVKKYGTGYLDALNAGALPKFATGGIVTGVPLSSWSNRYTNAVSIVEKHGKTAETAEATRPPVQLHATIQAWDGPSVDRWLENGGGRKLEKYFTKRGREFAAAGV